MLDTLGIIAYTGNKAIHKLAEWLGILIYIICRIHKAIIVGTAIAYVAWVIVTGVDRVNLIIGAFGALLILPLLYVIYSEKE